MLALSVRFNAMRYDWVVRDREASGMARTTCRPRDADEALLRPQRAFARVNGSSVPPSEIAATTPLHPRTLIR